MNQIQVYKGESNPEVQVENEYFRLSKVTYQSWGESVDMHRLEAKVKGQYVFVTRFESSSLERPYDHNKATLLRLVLACMDNKKGYIVEYSGKLHPNIVHGDEYGYGNPLEEIDDREMFGKKDELRKGFVTFTNLGHGIYSFCGNHENYSGAFYYFIWDTQIIKQIKNHLKENPQLLFKSKRRIN